MEYINFHNSNMALINHSLPIFENNYKIKHLIYIELFNNLNKALLLSNVPGLAEKFHTLGKFSNEFYSSIEKTNLTSTRTFLWPNIPKDEVGLSLKEHGLCNGITIINKSANSIRTLAYVGNNEDPSIPELFLNEKFSFFNFIPHFQAQVINKINIKNKIDLLPFKCSHAQPLSDLQTKEHQTILSNMPARYYLLGKYSSVYITPREKLCVSLLAHGKTYKEIAADLKITNCTVKKHIDAIKLKTGIFKKSTLIAMLLSMGAIELNDNFISLFQNPSLS